jgi:peroxiredoxin
MKLSKIIIAFCCILGLTAMAPVTSVFKDGYKVGDKAIDFKLKNVDGSMVSMADYADARGFIIIFTCNTCPYSVANEDRIIALNDKYKKKGFPVIAINPNSATLSPGDSFSNMQKRAKNKGFEFPYLFDEQQTIFPVYGATRTPHVYVLNKENDDLIVKYIGAIDDSPRDGSKTGVKYVEDVVDALLDGAAPKHSVTKAIGCSIKS